MSKIRLDQLLVENGLTTDLKSARALIMAGRVIVNEERRDKAGERFAVDSYIRIKSAKEHVSRGWQKINAAFEHFGIDVKGLVCLDIGASSGGFTECMLNRGASKVYAVDTGTNQLDWSLRSDARVIALEGLNARNLSEEINLLCSPKASFAAIDVSFISIAAVLEPVLTVLSTESSLLVLVKPQFELPKEKVLPGGIVKDTSLQLEACSRIANLSLDLGLTASEPFPSPLPGQKKGNQEYFLHLR